MAIVVSSKLLFREEMLMTFPISMQLSKSIRTNFLCVSLFCLARPMQISLYLWKFGLPKLSYEKFTF